MKIKEVENRINASYNTIKKFVETNESYYIKIDNVTHVTEKGIKDLETKYGINSELLNEDSLIFYKNQIAFLHTQIEESRKYNDLFVFQIENHNSQRKIDQQQIKELENLNHKMDLENLELRLKLEQEKNKSIFQKIFGRSKNDKD